MKTSKKIDLYFNGDFLCSTNQSKTCKDAIKKYLDRISNYKFYNTLVDKQILKNTNLLKARFCKRGVL